MLFQLGARRIAAAVATGQVQQQQQRRMINHAIQNNSILRQLPMGYAPKRIRSTMAPLVQQLTNQMLWSQHLQGNVTTMRSFLTSTSPIQTRIPENVADNISSTISPSTTTTSRSMIILNLECGVLDEDDDGYVF
jgi:hypothetical protein